jgi:hypothetical protein
MANTSGTPRVPPTTAAPCPARDETDDLQELSSALTELSNKVGQRGKPPAEFATPDPAEQDRS